MKIREYRLPHQTYLKESSVVHDLVFCCIQPTLGAERLFSRLTDNPTKADVIVFCGGQDIGTSLYNEKPDTGYSPNLPTNRDIHEMAVLDHISPLQQVIGICRGMQFLAARLCGLKLIQHVDNHSGQPHDIVTVDGRPAGRVNSVHHQAVSGQKWKEGADFTLKHIAYSADHYTLPELGLIQPAGQKNIHPYGLVIQSHPEFGEPSTEKFYRVLELFLKGETNVRTYCDALVNLEQRRAEDVRQSSVSERAEGA